MKLRPYQEQAIEQLRMQFKKSKKKVILCAPTGAGKTVIFSAMTQAAAQLKKNVLIVTDRIELLTQSGGALHALGIKPKEIKANKKPDLSEGVYTAMVETLARRISSPEYLAWFQALDLIIFDEAHKQPFNKLFEYIAEKTYVIGATATPYREGNQQSLSDFYQAIVEVVKISELIEQGYLAKPRSYGVKIDMSQVKTTAGDYDLQQQADLYQSRKVYVGVVENYKKICDGKKTLAFAPTIASSQELQTEFKRKGYDCRHLDSNMATAERAEILKWYNDTPNAILCNVGILTTGFDAPTTQCVILYRATKSLPLFLQMVGRGARVTENKKEFFVLDFGNNIHEFKFWENDREWSLEKKVKREGSAPVKECPSCSALLFASAKTCSECGHVFERTKEEKERAELEELQKVPKAQAIREAKSANLDQLAKMVKAGTIKPFWVMYNRITNRQEALYFLRQIGYKDGWLYFQQQQGKFTHL